VDSTLASAFAELLWPLIFFVALFFVRHEIKAMLAPGASFAFEFMGNKIAIRPTKRSRPKTNAGTTGGTLPELELPSGTSDLPVDYLFLNHTSFMRANVQEDFKKITKVDATHYDIRVILDSYYKGALEQVERVTYYLDSSYPEPVQVRSQRENKFMLKEVANGEYVLLAKIRLRGKNEPIVLQRYITLWGSGPRIEPGSS